MVVNSNKHEGLIVARCCTKFHLLFEAEDRKREEEKMKSRCKEKIKRKSERHFTLGGGGEKEHHFVIRFPGHVHSSF
jgi:hypothetical protein